MSKVTFPAILTKVETMSDKGTKLVFNTRELGKDSAELFKLAHSEGWLLFSSEAASEADIPDEKPDAMLNSKTQAQRLRGVLYRLWEQNDNGKSRDFNQYYVVQTEKIIDQLKEKLE